MNNCPKELENITWTDLEYKFSVKEHHVTMVIFSGTGDYISGGKTLLLPSSVDISHQLHALTTVVF